MEGTWISCDGEDETPSGKEVSDQVTLPKHVAHHVTRERQRCRGRKSVSCDKAVAVVLGTSPRCRQARLVVEASTSVGCVFFPARQGVGSYQGCHFDSYVRLNVVPAQS